MDKEKSVTTSVEETSSVSYGKSAFDKLSTTKAKFTGDMAMEIQFHIAHSLQFGIDKFYGDMLTLLETLGLSEKQEKAIKTQFKKAFSERYRSTVEELDDLVWAVDSALNPSLGRSYTTLGMNQNKLITGYGEPPEID